MDQRELIELIARINTRDETYTNSTETTSWKALRQAERLEDPGLFSLLREVITENEGKAKAKREIRSAAYFIYGRLMEKAFSPTDALFFLQRLEVETDKHVLSSMLDRIFDWKRIGAQLSPGLDISPILALTRDERWQIRHNAIRALAVCPGRESREALAFYLRQEDEKAYNYEIYYANIAMQSIGEMEDIPLLERSLKSRRPDLKITARYAIRYIQERAAAPDKS